jgi:MinD superfamily P-loop ATPase
MTKRLNLILNGKGGVGKNFFAVNLAQYLKDKESLEQVQTAMNSLAILAVTLSKTGHLWN